MRYGNGDIQGRAVDESGIALLSTRSWHHRRADLAQRRGPPPIVRLTRRSPACSNVSNELRDRNTVETGRIEVRYPRGLPHQTGTPTLPDIDLTAEEAAAVAAAAQLWSRPNSSPRRREPCQVARRRRRCRPGRGCHDHHRCRTFRACAFGGRPRTLLAAIDPGGRFSLAIVPTRRGLRDARSNHGVFSRRGTVVA